MMEEQRSGPHEPGLPRLPLKATGLAAAAGGLYLLAGPRPSIEAGVLLLVVALAAAGVLLGAGAYGPATEGPLDLSARIGLGLLGGTLGALASLALRALLASLDIPGALGVRLAGTWTVVEVAAHLGSGGVWGMVLGVLFPHAPGAGPRARGALFSLVPTLYLLLKVYPFDRDLGWLGGEMGSLAFLFVLVLNLAWGAVAGAVIGWGETTDEAPVGRPIDSPVTRPIDSRVARPIDA